MWCMRLLSESDAFVHMFFKTFLSKYFDPIREHPAGPDPPIREHPASLDHPIRNHPAAPDPPIREHPAGRMLMASLPQGVF